MSTSNITGGQEAEQLRQEDLTDVKVIDTVSGVRELTDSIQSQADCNQRIYFTMAASHQELIRTPTQKDYEKWRISFLVILLEQHDTNKVYLIDVQKLEKERRKQHKLIMEELEKQGRTWPFASKLELPKQELGRLVFKTAGNRGVTLKDIFENETLPKITWDCRYSTAALFSCYNIEINCIADLHLIGFALRKNPFKFFYASLAESAKKHDLDRFTAWKQCKDTMDKILGDDLKRRTEIMFERPLTAQLIDYWANDVQLLPELTGVYFGELAKIDWICVVEMAMKYRVNFYRSFQPFSAGHSNIPFRFIRSIMPTPKRWEQFTGEPAIKPEDRERFALKELSG